MWLFGVQRRAAAQFLTASPDPDFTNRRCSPPVVSGPTPVAGIADSLRVAAWSTSVQPAS